MFNYTAGMLGVKRESVVNGLALRSGGLDQFLDLAHTGTPSRATDR
jgi:hypothetical protein